jgi:cytoskeletal protein CcmA (bactofilin family)
MSQQSSRQQPGGVHDTVRPHVVGATSTFVGRITHAGRVEVWGLVRGHVRALEVSIKHGGKIDGQVEANLVRNDGSLSGTVRAQCLELSKRSRIEGEIKMVEMGMEKGCRIGPNTQMMTPDPKMIPILTAEILHAEIETAQPSKPRSRPPRLQDAVTPLSEGQDMPRPYLVKT